jgi:hypothetical protein
MTSSSHHARKKTGAQSGSASKGLFGGLIDWKSIIKGVITSLAISGITSLAGKVFPAFGAWLREVFSNRALTAGAGGLLIASSLALLFLKKLNKRQWAAIAVGVLGILAIVLALTLPKPLHTLSLQGGTVWGDGLKFSRQEYSIHFDGKVNSAGYANPNVYKGLAGKTLILEFSNVGSSTFRDDGRMVKVTYNKNDLVLQPVGVGLIEDAYLPAENRKFEFKIPYNFDGKLGFTFYQADVDNLDVRAWYR